MKPILFSILVCILLIASACSPVNTPSPNMQAIVQKILADYSADISSGKISNPEIYSPEMQKLVVDRRAFYRRFFQVALHSNMTILTSRFDHVIIDRNDSKSGVLYVNATELMTGKGIYLSAEVCLPQAIYWAYLHSDDEAIKNELLNSFDVLIAEGKDFIGRSFDETGLSVSTHHLLMQLNHGKFQIIEDNHTDENPQDNPGGFDVVDWHDGNFQRKPPDMTRYPDFQKYIKCIEQNGQMLLNEYKSMYQAQ